MIKLFIVTLKIYQFLKIGMTKAFNFHLVKNLRTKKKHNQTKGSNPRCMKKLFDCLSSIILSIFTLDVSS